MTTDRPSSALSPSDAAAIVRTLGTSLIKEYGLVAPSDPGMNERNGWGSKQREQLLLALVVRLAVHTLKYKNAALSASDAGLADFAAQAFRKGKTRSVRDRAPITRNISRMVGGWMRRFGRKLKQDAVVLLKTDVVALHERKTRCRLILSFAYPRRIVQDRRLLVSAQFEEPTPDGSARPWPFRADPGAPEVALPEPRDLTAVEAQLLEHLLLSMKLVAEGAGNEKVRSYAESGLRAFVPWSVAKIVVAVFASVIAGTLIAGSIEWVRQRIDSKRLLPAITVRCTPKPAIVLRFPDPPAGGLYVEKAGVKLQVRNGIAVDDNPLVGGTNQYTVRAAETLLVPWTQRLTFTMPACPPSPAAACPTCKIDGTLELTETRGSFDLTHDKSGFGDAPVILPHIPVAGRHLDEHLDLFIVKDCDECRRAIRVRCYFGVIDEPDARVTLDFGDRSTLLSLKGADAVRTTEGGTLPLDSSHPRLAAADNLNGPGTFYSLLVLHEYANEGSYLISANVESRAAPSEPYTHVKTLQRQIRVGTVATVEMTESYHLRETNEATPP